MSLSPILRRELSDLLGRLRDGELDGDRMARLDALIGGDADARRLYLDYVDLCASLHWARREKDLDGGEKGERLDDLAVADSPLAITPLSPFAPPLSPSFVGGPVFSYMVATVVLCLMLLGAWAYKINYDRNAFVDSSRRSTTSDSLERRQLVFVGRVTGMKGCRWADPGTGTCLGASVPLDRRYALASGLMEITYTSGVRVILEGPCTYKVESSAGGFLALGKITARIEAKGSGFRVQDSEHSPLSTLHSPLFAVRTPTAIITDLGTEFGVEVAENGDTTSHVFQGMVKVEILPSPAGRGARGEGLVQLAAGESVRVSRVRAGTHHNSTTTETARFTHPTTPPEFVRRIYEPPKFIDLLDVVAGGNGAGNRRERGIDPVSGWEDPMFVPHYRVGDRQYRPVFWNRLIDGVFIPDGASGAVQVDSARHMFDGFPRTSGEAYGSIWSRAADIGSKRVAAAQPWVYSILQEEKYMPERRGLLGIYANGGITFDLQAVRGKYPNSRPTRFRAVAGLADGPRKDPEALGMADVWVFVDGELKLKREKLRVGDGAFQVDVELGPDDRFLTLVATDGGDGISWDSVVFGDPILEMNEFHDHVTSSENGKEAKHK
ncbi:MAG: NPCBM/NEW2 domain-containing protein [Pirellulales bacterium]|nr:NPCBM/NEW2 domain-containing protein [Pirellulales bacterium]